MTDLAELLGAADEIFEKWGHLGDGWLPIESAPKGRAFIRTFHPALSPPERIGFWRPQANRWGYMDGQSKSEIRHQPTHWMPLPAPPEAARTNADFKTVFKTASDAGEKSL